jgi:hypothetical protein
MFHLVLVYDCESWALTLRVGRGLRVFDSEAIFGPKMEENEE